MSELAGLEIDVSIIQGRDLVAKDRGKIGLGKKTTSDPFVKIFFEGIERGHTKTVPKNLSPAWNQDFKIHLNQNDANRFVSRKTGELHFHIFDEDKLSAPDYMGGVTVPLAFTSGTSVTSWYPVNTSTARSPFGSCHNATGELQIKVTVSARRALSLVKGNSKELPPGTVLRVGLGWEMENNREIDLDTSCVAVGNNGNVLMDETVYFADLINSNRSIRHSGDEREGDENLGGTGDDEVITCVLDRVPSHVLALYFISTVATQDMTFADVRSAIVRVKNDSTGFSLCRFVPAMTGDHTAMFLFRVARSTQSRKWVLSIIEDTDHTARDFGTLIPEIKGYSRDICPSIKSINPKERIAIMRKGGTIRLRDYTDTSNFANPLVFGLAWDVTHGVNIDLDASAICLDADLNLVDTVYFGKLFSSDGAIVHSGDEREGDSIGDDEKMTIHLDDINPDISFIGFVVNSFSGQELDDVSRASCHLFDPKTRKDVARYVLSGGKELDKHTALVMGCLYRESATHGGEWRLRIISEAAQGRTAKDNVDELQRFLRTHPPQAYSAPAEPEIVVNAMPSAIPIEDEEIVVGPMDDEIVVSPF
mmetsp:Transcript_12705/g.19680  ORF Transcript_12705/g.19680 Transcript_12705/m.19680 type:complete len:592 (-) Transcript_12705:71-1846(-)